MEKKLKKGIVAVFLANIINLGFSLATSFFLPKYLSVDTYASIKTFQLYVSYVGLLHFGYIDGVYLKYGGVELKHDLNSEFSLNRSTMCLFQILITSIALLLSVLFRDYIFAAFSLAVLPLNMNNYYKFLYQATGEFKLYGRVLNLTTISTFVLNMTLLFLLKSDNHIVYISLYVILDFIIWFILDRGFRARHTFDHSLRFSFKELYENIKTGFLLTVGNLASMFLTSMDRWFVKILMTTLDFAHYSFAVSVESFLNIAVTPITTTLYNFFCNEESNEKRKNVFNYVLIFATILPSIAFPAQWFINIFLEKYLGSIAVIFLLFDAQMFYIVIKSVFVNLYKVNRQQKRYFTKLSCVLILGFVFNVVFYYVLHNKEAFAIGTLLSAIVWFMLTVVDFKELRIGASAYCYLFLEALAFLILGYLNRPVIGFFAYLGITIFFLTLLMRASFVNLIKNVRTVAKLRG